MNQSLPALRKLIDRMPAGEARISALEEAVRLADASNDVPAGYELRLELMQQSVFGGHPEKSIVAFAWILAQSDRDPARFPEEGVLWQYKWAVHHMSDFPQITAVQIDDALNDMARRFERNGASLRPIHQLRCMICRAMGDVEGATAALTLWRESKRDHLADCAACDRNAFVNTHYFLGKLGRGLDLAAPLLDGRMTCSSVPQTTYAMALLPLMRLGRVEEAAARHKVGYRAIRGKLEYVEEIGDHLAYLALIDNVDLGVKVLERHAELCLGSVVPMNRLAFWRGALALARRLQESPRKTKKMTLPQTFPLWRKDRIYEVDALAAWLETECRALAAQFDARNGNTYQTLKVEEYSDLARLAAPAPESAEEDEE